MTPPPARFAVLAHHHPVPGYPVPHFDLLLEDPALPGEHRCRTWRLPLDPTSTAAPIPAEPLPPHRAHYLDHAGTVSGGRGWVEHADRGTLVWLSDDPVRVKLTGRYLTGVWSISGGVFARA